MSGASSISTDRKELAQPVMEIQARTLALLSYCEEKRMSYARFAGNSKWQFMFLQLTTIVFSALTPILLLTNSLAGHKWLQALPAALGGMAAAVNATFHLHEHWGRQSAAANALVNERVRFQSRTGKFYSTKLSADQALDNFANRISEIANSEMNDWRASLQQKMQRGRSNTSTTSD